jgi:acetyltransferase-like isoleucine patch superfamily enzyme
MTMQKQNAWRTDVAWRIAWSCATLTVAGAAACGVALLPVVLLWSWLMAATGPSSVARILAVSVCLLPSYVLFALALMMTSALLTRALGWRTPAKVEMRIADMDWRLMTWVRYMAMLHVVRLIAGALFRGSPIWTAYLRLHGARIGRRVYVNTLSVSDYNLLQIGDDVVIGADVHVSGHTVEGGLVKTDSVRIGRNVTIGLGSVIEIGVDIGPGCQVGALSLVPKHTTLDASAVYVGIPVRRLA